MIPDHVQAILKKHSLKALEFEAGSTPTAEMAAQQIGVSVGQIAKSILMRGKDENYRMFVLAGDRKISSSKVKKLTGIKHSMAKAEETKKITGFWPGSVCPFGIEEIEIYIDRSLAEYDIIYPAAGTDASGVPVSYNSLIDICSAVECSVAAVPE